MQSLLETLVPLCAPLCAVAALLAGCGGSPTPVNSAEVPAATEVKPSSAPAAQPAPAPAPAPAAPARR